ncbi:MAG: HAD family hydrolase [Desulfobulbaceae bacterium]|nr:HAD family hydrolase [Desulfobulbaceae bacterium]
MQIVIFDMDGTLIDSGHDITASVNHVRETVYGLGSLARDFVIEAINRDQRNLALLFYETQLYEPEAQRVFEAHYHHQCIRTPRLYSGIATLLNDLVALGVRVSVATNAPARFARRMLAHLEIDDLFDVIVGSEDVEKSKPHPDMLHLVLNGYDYRPQRDYALMVGDNGKDMEAARRAGISGAFVTWGFSPKGIGDLVCSRPDELLQLVRIGGAGAS